MKHLQITKIAKPNMNDIFCSVKNLRVLQVVNMTDTTSRKCQLKKTSCLIPQVHLMHIFEVCIKAVTLKRYDIHTGYLLFHDLLTHRKKPYHIHIKKFPSYTDLNFDTG